MRRAGIVFALVVGALMAFALMPSCGSGDESAPEHDTSSSVLPSSAPITQNDEASSSVVRTSSESSEDVREPDVSNDEESQASDEETNWQSDDTAPVDYGNETAGVEPRQAPTYEAPASSEKSQDSATDQKSGGSASSAADAPKQPAKQDSVKTDPAPSDDPKPEPKQQKKWVDAVYETVEHPEEGHYESVVIGQRYFCLCGVEVDSPEGWKQHRADFIASNGGVCNGQHVSYSIEDVTEDQYVVDSPAWSEQVLISEGHWE